MGMLWQRISAEQPAPPWGVLTAVSMTIGAFAAIVLGAGIVGSFAMQPPTAPLLAYCIGMGFAALLVTAARNRTPSDAAALGLARADMRWPLILMLSFGVGAAFDLLTLALTNQPLIVPELASAGGVAAISRAGLGVWVLAAFLLLVLQPIGEGLVFRGVTYPALRRYLGARAGFLMTALWHGIFHMVVYAPQSDNSFGAIWLTLIVPTLAGLYLGAVRAVTGSTRASMVAHAGLGLFFIVRALTVAS